MIEASATPRPHALHLVCIYVRTIKQSGVVIKQSGAARHGTGTAWARARAHGTSSLTDLRVGEGVGLGLGLGWG